MKEKILAALKTKYANKGFSAKTLESVADFLTPTVQDETNIDNAVSGVESLLSVFQSETDSRVNAAVDKAKKDIQQPATPPAAPEPGKGTPPSPNENGTPEWAKALITKIETLEAQTKGKTHLETFTSAMKEKEIPVSYYQPAIDGRNFKDETEVSEFVNKIETGYKTYYQELVDKGLGQQSKPVLGSPDPKTGVSPAVQDYLQSKTEQAKGNDLAGKELK